MTAEDVKKGYTTREQSQRLLKIGLPANSADCYYGVQGTNPITDKPYDDDIMLRLSKEQLDEHLFDSGIFSPCWSAIRLYMIYEDSIKDEGLKEEGKIISKNFPKGYVEGIIVYLESLSNTELLDFSKIN